jgi:hypothetical protein
LLRSAPVSFSTAAHEQVAGEGARRGVRHHLVDLQLVVARAGLEEEVVRQVLDQVAGREHVVAGPRRAARVLGKRALAAGEEVVRVPDVLERLQGAARAAAVRRRRRRGAGQHRVDRLRHQFDVAELLGRDVRDEVVERPCALLAAEVERLERVVQERRHLAELPAQQFLDGGGAGRIRVGRRR